MKRNRAALVTSVSTAMLGAGWAAGMVGTAFAAQEPVLTTVGAAGSSSPTTETSTGTPASPSSDTTNAPSTDPSATSSPSAPSTTSAPAPATTSAPPPAPAAPSGTFDGASVKTRYGTYQVRLTVDAGKITDITMLQSGASDGTSRQISGYALPRLISAVLQSQTANRGLRIGRELHVPRI